MVEKVGAHSSCGSLSLRQFTVVFISFLLGMFLLLPEHFLCFELLYHRYCCYIIYSGAKAYFMMEYMQQYHSDYHQRQHLDCKRDSSKATPLRRKNAQMLSSPDRRSWVYTLKKVRVHKTMPPAKILSGTTNKG
jgi:hypothetical protein